MIVRSIITIRKGELSRREFERLFRALTFVDNEENEITAFEYVSAKDIVRVPRGAWSIVNGLKKVPVADRRTRPKMPKLTYVTSLDAKGYEGQEDAVAAMFKHEQGQVIAPPGRGKTEIGLAFASAARTRTLIVVHTKDLFQQWVDRIGSSVPNCVAGKIQGSDCQVEHITVAMAQTLKRHIYNEELMASFGCVIIDEAHHAAAETWEWLLNSCPAYYRFGLTATDKRADGRQALVTFNIGPVIYRIAFKSQVPLKVIPVGTKFRSSVGPSQWSRMMRQLVNDKERNQQIAKEVLRDYRQGHHVLVLSRHIKHLELIAGAIDKEAGDVMPGIKVLTGAMGQRHRDSVLQAFRDGDVRCVLATQLADEGLDVPRLDRVHLTFPGKHEGRIVQQIGRAIRKYPRKEDAIVYDYVDEYTPKLARQFMERLRTYRKLSIKIGKAVPHGKGKAEGKGKLRIDRDFAKRLTVKRSRR